MIVDDHALVRMGIKSLLDDVHGIDVVAEAENGETALKKAKTCSLDVVLLDMKMPGIDGLEVTRRMRISHPAIKIIAVTAFAKEPFPTRLLQAGALGYLTKECGLAEMTAAIFKVFQGQRYLSSEIAQAMALGSLADKSDNDSPFDLLSEREIQVTLLISRGMTVPEISKLFCLCSKTVNGYRYRLFKKLNVKNDVELVYLAMKHRLIEQPALVTSDQ